MKDKSKLRATFSEDASVAAEDWRLNVVTTLAQPATFQYAHPAGTIVKGIAQVDRVSGSELAFGVPNISALLIDSAQRLFDSGNQYFARLSADSKKRIEIFQAEGDLFEALEARMGCIVFSFTAIEAYANARIVGAYQQMQYHYTGKDRSGQAVQMSLEDIERNTSIEEKLLTILPQIMGVKLNKGRATWSAFKNLKRIRDRIIHCKNADLIGNKPGVLTLWHDLASDRFPNAPKDALELIGFFEDGAAESNRSRWFAKRPRSR